MILITGATGTNGRELVKALAAAGQKVRALVRDPARAAALRGPNVELWRGDLAAPDSLEGALAGAERAFLLPPVDERSVEWCRNFIRAAQDALPRLVVKLSAMGAAPDSPSLLLRMHAESDRDLRESGLPWNILQPNSFMQNFLQSAGAVKARNAFYLPLKDARQSYVDVRDITAVAREVLTGAPGDHEEETYVITGPEALTAADVARVLTEVLGRKIDYVPTSPEDLRKAMEGAGMPAWTARAVAELFSVFAAGKLAGVTDTVEKVTGKKPIPFARFARDHAAAFR